MNLSGTQTIPGPPEKVFDAIIDPETLRRTIPGCEKMTKTGEDSYEALLKIGLAGLKGSYTAKIQLKDISPPRSYTLIMEGKGAPGFVKGAARIELSASGTDTEMRYQADIQVGGLIAAVGSRLIEAAAKKISAEFFKKFAEEVKGR